MSNYPILKSYAQKKAFFHTHSAHNINDSNNGKAESKVRVGGCEKSWTSDPYDVNV